MKVVSFLPQNAVLESRLAGLAGRLGLPFVRCAGEGELLDLSSGPRGAHDMIVLSDEAAIPALERIAVTGARTPPVVLFVSTPLPGLVGRLKDTPGIANFVAINDQAPDESEVESLLGWLERAGGGALEDSIPTPRFEGARDVRDAQTKQALLMEVDTAIAAIDDDAGKAPSALYGEYARKMAELVDELVLNGVFNANPRFKTSDRCADFALRDDELVRVRWRWDGEFFGVSVRDPFGRLSRETVLRYLDEATFHESYQNVPSAGLGLKIVHDRLHKFIVNVAPSRSTEVICVARFERKLRDFDRRIRSFHYFCIDADHDSGGAGAEEGEA